MLLVKTTVKNSIIPEAGLGCFADEFIEKDTMIWKFDSRIDRVFDTIDNFSQLDQEFLVKYCYMHNGKYYLCVDNSRFFNHSSDPNTYESITQQATFSSRDIQPGEEIFSNYSDFGADDQDLKFNIQL